MLRLSKGVQGTAPLWRTPSRRLDVSSCKSSTEVTCLYSRMPNVRTLNGSNRRFASHHHHHRQRRQSYQCSLTLRRKSTTMPGSQGNGPASPAPQQMSVGNRINSWLNQPRTVPVPRWVSPSHFTTTYSEIFGHSSFILVAMAYYTDDFLNLRIMAIAGSASMLVFTYFHPHGRILWLPFKWNAMFIAINSYRVGRVYLDHWYASQMSADLKRLHDHHFYVMDTAEFGRLVRLAETQTYKKGDVIVQQSEHNPYLRLVLSGEINVLRDSQLTYQLRQGNFISEVGLHAGLLLHGAVESCCSVVANSDDVKVLCWDRSELMDLLDLDTNMQRSLKAVMSWDIVSKLKSQRVMLAQGLIHDPESWTKKRREQTQARYAAILHNMLSDPQFLKARKEELHKYREIHYISDESHEKALLDVGWTVEEFNQGYKAGQKDQRKSNALASRWKRLSKAIYFQIFGSV